MRVLLMIPAYNEQDSILQTCARIPDGVDRIVIDDGSADRTAALCRENNIPSIRLPHNLGIGGAMQCGYQYARDKGYDIAVQFDGDGQHDIRYLDVLTEPIRSGNADFVIGSRFLDSTSGFRSTFARRLGIRWLSGMVKILTGQRVTDPTSGFRAAGREVITRFAERYPTDFPETESVVSLLREGLRVCETPVNMYPRSCGKSSIRAFSSVYYMLKVSLAVLLLRSK